MDITDWDILKNFLFNKEGVPFNPELYPPGRDWVSFRESLEKSTLYVLQNFNLRYTILSGNLDQRNIAIRTFLEGTRDSIEGRSVGKERT